DSTAAGTNQYALTLVKVVGDNPAQEDGGPLLAGQTREGSFTMGDIDVYRFSATTGEVATLQLVSEYSSQPLLYLYGPDGISVTSSVVPYYSTTTATCAQT